MRIKNSETNVHTHTHTVSFSKKKQTIQIQFNEFCAEEERQKCDKKQHKHQRLCWMSNDRLLTKLTKLKRMVLDLIKR